jgi:hypothetical protein
VLRKQRRPPRFLGEGVATACGEGRLVQGRLVDVHVEQFDRHRRATS